jgi:hypothetical protein
MVPGHLEADGDVGAAGGVEAIEAGRGARTRPGGSRRRSGWGRRVAPRPARSRGWCGRRPRRPGEVVGAAQHRLDGGLEAVEAVPLELALDVGGFAAGAIHAAHDAVPGGRHADAELGGNLPVVEADVAKLQGAGVAKGGVAARGVVGWHGLRWWPLRCSPRLPAEGIVARRPVRARAGLLTILSALGDKPRGWLKPPGLVGAAGSG